MTVEFHVEPPATQETLPTPPFHTWELSPGHVWTEFHRGADGYIVRFPRLADFVVSRDGGRVSCRLAPDTAEDPGALARHLFANQVLPLALSRSGHMVFHASAVEVEGVALAFVGESGRGKSTLAAEFARHGCRFLCDDGLVVEPHGAGFNIVPGEPSLRLWEDSEEELIDGGVTRASPLRFTDKARFLAGDNLPHQTAARPLRHTYFLGDGSAPDIEIRQLGAAEAMRAWMAHSFLLDVDDRAQVAEHFERVAGLAEQPMHFHLDYPRRFEELGHLRERLANHACRRPDD